MQEPYNLRTAIAEPLQKVAKKLRPLAEKDLAYVDAYNRLCDVLEAFHNKLLRTGKGLEKDWEKFPPVPK